MNSKERERLQKLDDLIENASIEELKKIQETDRQTQIEGLSFYDVYVDSSALINQSIKKYSRKF